MNYLKQSTGIVVRIGPAVDATDGVSPETTLSLATADQAEILKANGAATVDISGATMVAVTGCDGWYDLTLTTAHTDTVGEMVIVIQDSSLCLPLFARFQVVEEAIYDKLFAGSAALNDLSAAQVNAECDTAISDAALATAAALSTVEGKVDTVDAVADKILKSAFAGAELAIGTASQSAPIVTGGPANDIASCLFVIFDNSASDSPIFIEGSYTGSTGTCNLNSTPPVTLTTSDKITIVALADAETIGTGTGLTAIPWNAAWDAEVQSEVADALTAFGAATAASIAALNDIDSAAVQTACNSALVALHLDHLLAVDYDPAAKPGVATALLNELVESDAGVSRFTVNALENGPSGSGASAAAIADAVWTELIADHSGTAGSTAAAVAAVLTDTGTTLPATLATLATESSVTTVDTVVDAIKAKTDQFVFTVANKVDANVHYANDVEVIGAGVLGNSWRAVGT